jgi:integrase
MTNSTGRKPRRKSTQKPRKEFPLSIHKGSGRWCKKVRGHVTYFGKVADDPKGEAALILWLDKKDDLLAGREPRAKGDPGGLVVGDLCNQFLAAKEALRDNHELSPRTFLTYHGTCADVCKAFGRNRLVSDLLPDDFRKLRIALAKKRGLVALGNAVTRVRSIFKFAFDEGLILAPVKCGQDFKKPKKERIAAKREEQRAKHGDQMFEAAEIRLMLAALDGKEVIVGADEKTGEPIKVAQKHNLGLRAMVLLAANCAYGQSDIANLPTKAMTTALETGWLDYGRGKTGVARKIPLWPETIAAIRDWLLVRPKAKEQADAHLLFLTCRGARFMRENKDGYHIDGIGQEFQKLIEKLKLKRPRLGVYSLRHGFETIAGETGDQVAVDKIMGHKDGSMAASYRERISDERLRRVVEFVRQWLFADSAGPGSTNVKNSVPSVRSVQGSKNKGENADAPRTHRQRRTQNTAAPPATADGDWSGLRIVG